MSEKVSYDPCYSLVEDLIQTYHIEYPVNPISFIKANFKKVRLVPYSELDFEQLLCAYAYSSFGFSLFNGVDKWIIYYNDDNSAAVIRFTILHELGHYLLGHRGDTTTDDEHHADCFSRNFISPITVIDRKGIEHTPEAFMDEFGISYEAAQVRCDLYDLDKFHINQLIERKNYERYVADMEEAMLWSAAETVES